MIAKLGKNDTPSGRAGKKVIKSAEFVESEEDEPRPGRPALSNAVETSTKHGRVTLRPLSKAEVVAKEEQRPKGRPVPRNAPASGSSNVAQTSKKVPVRAASTAEIVVKKDKNAKGRPVPRITTGPMTPSFKKQQPSYVDPSEEETSEEPGDDDIIIDPAVQHVVDQDDVAVNAGGTSKDDLVVNAAATGKDSLAVNASAAGEDDVDLFGEETLGDDAVQWNAEDIMSVDEEDTGSARSEVSSSPVGRREGSSAQDVVSLLQTDAEEPWDRLCTADGFSALMGVSLPEVILSLGFDTGWNSP